MQYGLPIVNIFNYNIVDILAILIHDECQTEQFIQIFIVGLSVS